MKLHIISRLVLVAIAIVASVAIVRRDTLHNIAPCETTPGCVSKADTIGAYTTVSYGFPVAYRTSESFSPNDSKRANYKEVTIAQKSASIPVIIIDVLFWFALLELLWRTRLDIRAWYKRRFLDESHPAKSDKPTA